MHEMSILTNEVDTVLVYAAENNASWVIEVSLVVGDLCLLRACPMMIPRVADTHSTRCR